MRSPHKAQPPFEDLHMAISIADKKKQYGNVHAITFVVADADAAFSIGTIMQTMAFSLLNIVLLL